MLVRFSLMRFRLNCRIVTGPKLESDSLQCHDLIRKAIALGLKLLVRLQQTGQLLGEFRFGGRSAQPPGQPSLIYTSVGRQPRLG